MVWIKNGRHEVKEDHKIKFDLEQGKFFVSIINVTEDDFGEYGCEASNSYGTSSASIMVVGGFFPFIELYSLLTSYTRLS